MCFLQSSYIFSYVPIFVLYVPICFLYFPICSYIFLYFLIFSYILQEFKQDRAGRNDTRQLSSKAPNRHLKPVLSSLIGFLGQKIMGKSQDNYRKIPKQLWPLLAILWGGEGNIFNSLIGLSASCWYNKIPISLCQKPQTPNFMMS